MTRRLHHLLFHWSRSVHDACCPRMSQPPQDACNSLASTPSSSARPSLIRPAPADSTLTTSPHSSHHPSCQARPRFVPTRAGLDADLGAAPRQPKPGESHANPQVRSPAFAYRETAPRGMHTRLVFHARADEVGCRFAIPGITPQELDFSVPDGLGA
jgi:hypothetical protein